MVDKDIWLLPKGLSVFVSSILLLVSVSSRERGRERGREREREREREPALLWEMKEEREREKQNLCCSGK